MENLQTVSVEDKQRIANELIEAAENGADVSKADPRHTSIEAVVTVNKIMRAQGGLALNIVRSGL